MSVKYIKISEDILNRCREFAEKCMVTNLDAYKKRNQSNPKTIIEQIVTGKLGEFAVSLILGTEEPDLQIYAKKDKSYSADLIHENKEIHVKSQTKESSERYGKSWSFSIFDSLITKPKLTDYIAPCILDGLDVEFYGLWQMSEIKHLLREPVLYQLKNSKRVLYWEDLELKFPLNIPIE